MSSATSAGVARPPAANVTTGSRPASRTWQPKYDFAFAFAFQFAFAFAVAHTHTQTLVVVVSPSVR